MPSSTKRWGLEGLGADGPNGDLKQELMLLGQFVGDWDIIEDRFFLSGGREQVLDGEAHMRWIIDGLAVQDVWLYHDKKLGRAVPVGTTIRFYDPKLGKWRSTWISPSHGDVIQFVGQRVGSEIVFEGKNAEGNPIRWILFEAKPNSFRWRSEVSEDGGMTWRIEEEMKLRRRGRRAKP